MQICSRCIYSEKMGKIQFDERGECNYCKQIDAMSSLYGSGKKKGQLLLDEIIKDIKLQGKGKKYDCVVGVSGGTDSSFLLMKAVDWGLKPLAVHYDNTWNTAEASMNIKRVTDAFNVDLITHVVDKREADDLFKAFLLAGVPEWDASTDIALAQVIRKTAAKYNIRYVLEGHSFQAEGISPASNNYFDGAYVRDIHKKYGTVSLRTFPILSFWQMLKWSILYRQKFVRPLWYLNYTKADAQKELIERVGWVNYGGHHLENRAAIFGHQVYAPQKFGIDYRFLTLAARVRAGQMLRDDALQEFESKPNINPEIIGYVSKRLKLSKGQINEHLCGPKRSWRDFKTYKKRFVLLAPFFLALAKANRIPMTFYLKYCNPDEK